MSGRMTGATARQGGPPGSDSFPLAPPPALDVARDALFLDLDGTLVAIAERPDLIQADEALRRLLRRVGNLLRGRLVIISGRPLADLDRHLQGAAPLAAGVHGAELRGAATPAPGNAARDEAVRQALDQARRSLREEEDGLLAEGLLVEDKDKAIALHFRQRPALGARSGRLAAQLADASGGLLAVQPGRMVFELKPAGVDKGQALRAFLATPGFAGSRPVVVGDDLTDEAAFRAAAEAGGHGILVGRRSPTAARYALPDVDAVLAWLGALARR